MWESRRRLAQRLDGAEREREFYRARIRELYEGFDRVIDLFGLGDNYWPIDLLHRFNVRLFINDVNAASNAASLDGVRRRLGHDSSGGSDDK